MTSVDRWVRAGEESGKVPLQLNGKRASSTLAATWTSFEKVCESSVGSGFGIMLGGGLAVVDVDNALDDSGVLKDWARDEIADLGVDPVFVEVSMSGRGLHIFHEAPEGRGRKMRAGDGGVELYSRARFVRVTGSVFDLK